MATRFASMFAKTGAPNLMLQFGDSITYLPSAGGSRSIQAMIERETVESSDGVLAKQMIVRVKNSATEGIAATEINEGGDQVQLPIRVGESAVTKTILHVLSTENGLVRFLVQ